MKPTLVTGTPGWCGTRLVKVMQTGLPGAPAHLQNQQGRKIRCLILPGMNADSLCADGPVELVPGDLRSPADAARFCQDAEGSTLFHCAGLIHPKLRTKELYEVNVRGTENLLQAATAARVRRVVILSSNSPFGVNPNREHRFDENSPYHPYMNYGKSKMMMEQVVKKFQETGDLEIVVLRPTWFYGPDQPVRQTTFFSMIKNGMAPILGDGGNMRSMAYIDNLCQALLLAEQTPQANGKTYWVADKRPYPMTEIVDTVERLMENEFNIPVAHKRLRLPYIAGEVAQLADWTIQSVGFYQQKIHVLSEMNKNIACSVEAAQRDLGYEPTIELEEGMRRSLAWCAQQGIQL